MIKKSFHFQFPKNVSQTAESVENLSSHNCVVQENCQGKTSCTGSKINITIICCVECIDQNFIGILKLGSDFYLILVNGHSFVMEIVFSI